MKAEGDSVSALMFTAVFREVAAGGAAGAELAIPAGAKPSKKGSRIVFSATYEKPVRVPDAGHVTLKIPRGEKMVTALTFEYAGAGFPADRPEAAGATRTPAETEARWVQLNTTKDRFVIQLKLQKMTPESLGTGAYGVTRFVVHAATSAAAPPGDAPRPEPKTDKDRALMI